MPRKSLKRTKTNTNVKKEAKKTKSGENKGSLAAHLSMQLGQVSLMVRNQQSPAFGLANSSRFQAMIDEEAEGGERGGVEVEAIGFGFGVEGRDEKEFILSQDFFWYGLG